MSTDQKIEQDIQAKGLTAPRVTTADIETNIASENYFTGFDGIMKAQLASGTAPNVPTCAAQLTFCILVLRNGFTVTGESACASPENFDAEIGRQLARANAVQKVWPLLGFRLRDELSRTVLTEADAAADLAGIPRPSRAA
jgi:hypothetical protein